MKLRDTLPRIELREAVTCGAGVTRYLHLEVIATHENGLFPTDPRPWPGTHRYVHNWYEVEGERAIYAVGWNENPSTGHSFPVVKLRNK